MSPKRSIFPNKGSPVISQAPRLLWHKEANQLDLLSNHCPTMMADLDVSERTESCLKKNICWKNWLKSPSSRYPVLDKVSVCRCHALQGSFFVWAGWLYFCDAHPLIGSGRWRFIRIPEPKNVMILVVTIASQVLYPTGSHQPAFLWVMVLGGSMMYLAPQKTVKKWFNQAWWQLPKKSYQNCPFAYLTERLGGKNYKKIDVDRLWGWRSMRFGSSGKTWLKEGS